MPGKDKRQKSQDKSLMKKQKQDKNGRKEK
jgi:hypothetical protein